jgi:hypothetical protein
VLPRLVLLLLLAFALVSGRGWTPVEAPVAAVEVLDAETSGDVVVVLAFDVAGAPPLAVQVTRLLGPTTVVHPTPELGRVFRPPRSLGS